MPLPNLGHVDPPNKKQTGLSTFPNPIHMLFMLEIYF